MIKKGKKALFRKEKRAFCILKERKKSVAQNILCVNDRNFVPVQKIRKTADEKFIAGLRFNKNFFAGGTFGPFDDIFSAF